MQFILVPLIDVNKAENNLSGQLCFCVVSSKLAGKFESDTLHLALVIYWKFQHLSFHLHHFWNYITGRNWQAHDIFTNKENVYSQLLFR